MRATVVPLRNMTISMTDITIFMLAQANGSHDKTKPLLNKTKPMRGRANAARRNPISTLNREAGAAARLPGGQLTPVAK